MKKKRISKKIRNNKRLKLLGLLVVLLLIVVFYNIKKKDDEFIEGPEIEQISFVRGTDVSRYQGEVDFNVLYEQSIRFAFIKATEGAEYLDSSFTKNWKNAKAAGMKVGAYHFYSFESSGLDQAKNFINKVSLEDEDLPPTIDLEFYGDYIHNPVDADIVRKELRDMVNAFKDHYNKKPIIYCNKYVYEKYSIGDFKDVDIWYRSIEGGYPRLSGGRIWMFWQFDDKAKLDGYGGSGANEFIDLNYFRGDMEELENYGRNIK